MKNECRPSRPPTAVIAAFVLAAVLLAVSACGAPTGPAPPAADADEQGAPDETPGDDDPDLDDPEEDPDPPDPPVVTLAAEREWLYEHQATTHLTVGRSTAEDEVTVLVSISGTAMEGEDYTYSGWNGAAVVLPPGESSVAVALQLIDDRTFEPDKTIDIALVAAEGYTLGTESSVTITIRNDDAPEHDPVTLVLDFDGTVPGYSCGAYTGSGFASEPADGQLDADEWLLTAISDGDKPLGVEANTGDAARGLAAGAVSTGGLYAFEVAPDNRCIGVQPTSSDWTAGSIGTQIRNTSGGAVDTLTAGYTVWEWNDQGRSSSVTLAVSSDGATWSPVETTTVTSVEPATTDPAWIATEVAAEIALTVLFESGLLPDGEVLYVGWIFDDVGGSGGRDQLGIDAITLSL